MMLDELRRGADADAARGHARERLNSLAQLDYLDVVDADTFEPLARLRPPAFVIGAARFGKTRLIDNLMVTQ
jgi:pantoate--beta-alanine ligase